MAEKINKKALSEILEGRSKLLSMKNPMEFMYSAADLYFTNEEECEHMRSPEQYQQYFEFQPNEEAEWSENSDVEESTSPTWLESEYEEEPEEECTIPMFAAEEMQHNIALVESIKEFEEQKVEEESRQADVNREELRLANVEAEEESRQADVEEESSIKLNEVEEVLEFSESNIEEQFPRADSEPIVKRYSSAPPCTSSGSHLQPSKMLQSTEKTGKQLKHSRIKVDSKQLLRQKRKLKATKKSAKKFKTYLKDSERRLSLVELEKKIMKSSCGSFETFDVDVGEGVLIHTAHVFTASSRNQKSTAIPLVLLHGFGGAIPTFHKLYRILAVSRSVYAIDMPGFGHSTRVKFPNDPEACEKMIVCFISKWRAKMEIDKMILLGHSLGGYFAAAYFLRYYRYIQHLVLLEPWGMYSQDDDENSGSTNVMMKKLAKNIFDIANVDFSEGVLNFGQHLSYRLLKLLMDKETRTCYGDDCLEYFVRHCTEQLLTGTKAFKLISDNTFQYPMKPLKDRLIKLLGSVKTPITILYGRHSDVRKSGLSCACALARPTVTVHCIDDAGHHIQVQNPTLVVKYILMYIYPNYGSSK